MAHTVLWGLWPAFPYLDISSVPSSSSCHQWQLNTFFLYMILLLTGKDFTLSSCSSFLSFASVFIFFSPFLFHSYFKLFQLLLLMSLLKAFPSSAHILNIQYTLARSMRLLWFYNLKNQYSGHYFYMSWLLSIQTCCHQLQYLDWEFDMNSLHPWEKDYKYAMLLNYSFSKEKEIELLIEAA